MPCLSASDLYGPEKWTPNFVRADSEVASYPMGYRLTPRAAFGLPLLSVSPSHFRPEMTYYSGRKTPEPLDVPPRGTTVGTCMPAHELTQIVLS